MDLTFYLDQILAWHQRYNTPAARFLQSGLGEDEILGKIRRLPFKLPREFVDLYRWRNGVPIASATGDTSFFEYHRFLPLDEALNNFDDSYPIMKQFYERTDWVLTFQDPAGDGYGVMPNGKDEERGQIAFLFEGEGVQIVFDSLTAMMHTMVACFEQGVFTWREDQLQTDFYSLGELALRLNPSIQYWRDYGQYGRPSNVNC